MDNINAVTKWCQYFGEHNAFQGVISKIDQGCTLEEVREYAKKAKDYCSNKMEDEKGRLNKSEEVVCGSAGISDVLVGSNAYSGTDSLSKPSL